jgi:hypothetical protein
MGAQRQRRGAISPTYAPQTQTVISPTGARRRTQAVVSPTAAQRQTQAAVLPTDALRIVRHQHRIAARMDVELSDRERVQMKMFNRVYGSEVSLRSAAVRGPV